MALWDFALTKDGSLDISGNTLHMVTGAEAVRQRLWITLNTIRGEWFQDVTVGLPLGPSLFGKVGDRRAVDSLIRTTILTVEGITNISKYESTYDSKERTFHVKFIATHEDEGKIGYADYI